MRSKPEFSQENKKVGLELYKIHMRKFLLAPRKLINDRRDRLNQLASEYESNKNIKSLLKLGSTIDESINEFTLFLPDEIKTWSQIFLDKGDHFPKLILVQVQNANDNFIASILHALKPLKEFSKFFEEYELKLYDQSRPVHNLNDIASKVYNKCKEAMSGLNKASFILDDF